MFFNIFYSCSKLNSGSLIITVTYLFWCVVIVFVKSKLIASYWYGFNFYWSIFFVVVVFFCSIMLDGKSWFRYIVEYFVLEYNQVRCTYYLYHSTLICIFIYILYWIWGEGCLYGIESFSSTGVMFMTC